jgi:hypothetical protein
MLQPIAGRHIYDYMHNIEGHVLQFIFKIFVFDEDKKHLQALIVSMLRLIPFLTLLLMFS